MRYLILLVDDETTGPAPGTPEWDADMAGYERFDTVAGDAILAGEALSPAATATTGRPAEAGPRVTAGPFAEQAGAALRAGGALHPAATATTPRVRGGRPPGPFCYAGSAAGRRPQPRTPPRSRWRPPPPRRTSCNAN